MFDDDVSTFYTLDLAAGLTQVLSDGDSYTGYHGTSDESGQVVFTLPQGDYRFRADYDGVQFWSGLANHCPIPGCLDALVEIPGGVGGPVSVTIDYAYDPLQRLVAADYSTGEFFHYSYDAVGNRLTQDTLTGTNTYVYDIANRLEEVDGFSYIWDDNGNLHDDGVREYSYDHANRLISVEMGDDEFEFEYSGLGDHLRQTVNGAPIEYTLDLAAGLTQVLHDGTNAYLYGVGRIGELQPDGWQYHLGDALGSVRQLADPSAAVGLAQGHEPFGSALTRSGAVGSIYGFTGEQADPTGLVFLRARHYAPSIGRFVARDSWPGLSTMPGSLHKWAYVVSNPVNVKDPTGRYPEWCRALSTEVGYALCVLDYYHLFPSGSDLAAEVTGSPGCWEGPIGYTGGGYEEGYAWFFHSLPGVSLGREMVYDFATMERQPVRYYMLTVDDSIAVGYSEYAGLSYGFRSTETLEFDYEGGFVLLSADAGTGTAIQPIQLSTGVLFFATTNWVVVGVNWFVSGGLALPTADVIPIVGLEVGAGWADAIAGASVSYVDVDTGQLALSQLLLDIGSGVNTGWRIAPAGHRASSRAAGIASALYWGWIYNEIHNAE